MTGTPKKKTFATTSRKSATGGRKASTDKGAATAAKSRSKAKAKSTVKVIPREKPAEKKKPAAAAKPKPKAKAKSTVRPIPRKRASAKKTPVAAAKPKTPAKPKPEPIVAEPATAWEPQIVVFACNWCSYAGADTAGVSRIQHQPNFRMIRVMCSGRIQPAFVLRAFEKGADGVLVSGCHIGDCHYIFGNERALEQFDKTVNMVKLLGIEQGRLRLEWISAAEGGRFAAVINEFTDQVRSLGPSPFSRKMANEKKEEVA
jgi:F420-non-reducing hydrogenase iron-sulfur subunit